MRPIETNYRSVTFRSRLEARWAVFFDAIEYAWLYEQRTVPFGSGEYTPDFWLDKLGVYAEVKPCWPTKLEQDKMKAVLPFCNGILLLLGPPAISEYWLLTPDGERLVLLKEHLVSAPMDDLIHEGYFSLSYVSAVDKAKHFHFDGYDDDRATINQRYR